MKTGDTGTLIQINIDGAWNILSIESKPYVFDEGLYGSAYMIDDEGYGVAEHYLDSLSALEEYRRGYFSSWEKLEELILLCLKFKIEDKERDVKSYKSMFKIAQEELLCYKKAECTLIEKIISSFEERGTIND